MDFSTLLLCAALTILPLIGAGLLAVMVLLERPEPLTPATANGASEARRRPRRKAARRQR
ncbi:MAG: hypothetical protein WAN86_21255 [Hyphomicrobiaceae bacterium]